MDTGLGGRGMVTVQILIVPQVSQEHSPQLTQPLLAYHIPSTVTSPPTTQTQPTATKLHQPPCPNLPHPPCTAQPRK